MRHILFYILIICAAIQIYARNADNNLAKKETNGGKITQDDLEKEAKRDIEDLLKNKEIMTAEDKNYKKTTNKNGAEPDNTKNNLITDKIEHLLRQLDIERRVSDNLEFEDLLNPYNDGIGTTFRNPFNKLMNNLASSHRSVVKNRPVLKGVQEKSEFETSSIGETIGINRLMKKLDLNHRDMVRNRVAAVNEKYHSLLNSNNKEGLRLLVNKLNVNPLAYPGVFVSLDKYNDYSRTSANDAIRFGDLLNSVNDNSLHLKTNYLRNIRGGDMTDLDDDDENKNYENSNEDGSDYRDLALRKAVNYNNDKPDSSADLPTRYQSVKQKRHARRIKRSAYTQAGYTQDPDTCKTYNENLIKLWTNLSKYINVTEQPNERALHNIAVMIQAYLDHQNLKVASVGFKTKHEGSRDKTSEVLFKIRKMIEENEATPDKITKVITKYFKPPYEDIDNGECQEVNEESLASAIVLLYKNYLENSDCRHDGDGVGRNKGTSLRSHLPKNLQTLSSNWEPKNNEYKPEIKSILLEDEFNKDFHRGKIPRNLPTAKLRRSRRSRKQNARSLIYRSGDQNVNDSSKLKSRSKASHKSSSRKLKKKALKSDSGRGRCEKYAARKFTVSLRPVIDRFMSLLECQLDNTLRSDIDDEVLIIPYEFYSDGKSLNKKNNLHRTKLTRIRNSSPKKSRSSSRYDNFEKREDDNSIYLSNDEHTLVRKHDLNKKARSKSTSTRASSLDLKVHNKDGDLANQNEYFQSPPKYDDYDGFFKSNSEKSNGSPKLINPLVGEDENIADKTTNKILVTPLKEKASDNLRNNVFDTFYDDDFPDYTKQVYDVNEQTEPNNSFVIVEPSTTKLLNTNLEQTQKAVQNLESITEFLKNARDVSLQTPEFAVPFALDSNKGYVELTHLVKYPKIIVYRPQFIVKNTMPYDDFLKTINNINMTNEEARLMKIVRHLPDNTVKVLFETEDFESPLEVRNIKDNRRSGGLIPTEQTPLERIGMTREDDEYDDANSKENSGESLISINRDEAETNFTDVYARSGEHDSNENDLQSILNSNLDASSETNTTLASPLNSSDLSLSSRTIPSFASNLLSNIGSGLVPGISSIVASNKNSDSDLTLGSAVDLSSIHPSQLSTYLSKIIPAHLSSKTQQSINLQTDSNSQALSSQTLANSQSDSYSQSHSHSYSISSSSNSTNTESENFFTTSKEFILNGWWKKWKRLVKKKIEKLAGKMASLADSIDKLINL